MPAAPYRRHHQYILSITLAFNLRVKVERKAST
jgi:hypothetical protein